MKAKALLRVLQREPLAYKAEKKGAGSSHRKLVSRNGFPVLFFSFHDNQNIGGTMVRKILVNQVGLDDETALEILGG